MLHIILLILKIIGMTILVILGLLLLILLTVLLVPVRYCVAAERGDEFRLEGHAGWFLNLFGVKFSHLEGKFHIRIRALWFILYDNLKPIPSKIKKGNHKATVKKNKTHRKHAKVESERKEKPTEKNKVIQTDEKKQIAEECPDEKGSINNNPSSEANSEEVHQEEKKSVFQKIYHKIICFRKKITAFFSGIKSKIIKWYDTVVNLKQKVCLISDFIKDEYNKEGFSVTFVSLRKLLKHMMPTKLKARIVFGTGDPCSTGQDLGFMGILYSFYGDKIQVIPDFENIILEGKLYAKGRIRLITVLIIVINLLLDKRFKQLKSNFEILKEAL